MKFAKYLESESIPEWRRAYINYKGLKKKLKAVEKFRKVNERRAAIELEHALQGLDTDSDPDRPIYKTDTTTEWHWPWRTSEWYNSGGSGNALQRQPSFPHSLIRKLSSRFQGDDTELSRVRSRAASIQSTTTLSVLEEVLLHASEPERAFFKMLNGESDKVSRFYDEKESEARAKLEALKIQMQLIAEYGRRLVETGRNNNSQQQHASPPQNAYHHHGFFNGLFHRNRPEDQPTLHLPHMPASIDYTTDHHVSYNVARSRLKKALTEFYRSLEFLRSYKLLNETGFRKILKKFDKTAGWKASDLYLQRLRKYHWMTSVDLNSIIKETESLYIDEFADGHRRRGMRKLRVPEKHEDYNSTTLRIGLYLGIALPLLVHACQLAFDPETLEHLPNAHTNLQIYACFLLPILFCLGFAIDLIIWHRYRISYKFIFELDPRHNLDYHQFGELPALLFAIASFIMYIDFSQTFAPTIPSELCPLILFIVILAIILCPFNIFYYSARKWLGVALGRIFLSYCFRVEFRDFFIADELNSLAYSFWTLSYFFCAYGWHWNDLDTHCNVPYMWITPIIASLPPWWRFLQCLRRYKDSEEKLHLVNGAKYLSSILATVVSAVRRISPSPVSEAMLVLTCTFNSCYTSLWDIKMDWGLLQPCSKNFLLRDDLVFKKRIYYAAAVIDVLLRFAWTLNFAGLAVNGQILSFAVAVMEAYRRIQWNVFRLENEHLNNCGQYRAIKEIPLPFAMRENVKSLGDEEEGSIQLPITNHNTAAVPIPIANANGDLMVPVSRHNSRYSHRDSIYSGSFYGRRDFENRHEHADENKEAKSLQQPVSTIENVLTHIRSNFGTAGSDGSDSEHDDNDDDDDDDDNGDIVQNLEP